MHLRDMAGAFREVDFIFPENIQMFLNALSVKRHYFFLSFFVSRLVEPHQEIVEFQPREKEYQEKV